MTPAKQTIPDVRHFRRRSIESVGARSRRARLMRLVDQVLDPTDQQAAAGALIKLISLLSRLDGQTARSDAHLHCVLQATFHFRDWPELLRLNIVAITEIRGRGKKTEVEARRM